ncbi:MAG: radical SAM protein [Eubacteriales bacterium]|nr:radical SAM protein [Eubacteriales bacterium]
MNTFYTPDEIYAQTKQKLSDIGGEHVDYLTFVPDGEPTLDVNLGRHIDLLREFGIKTAVITNASLIWMDEVKEDLLKADWVSMKIDAINPEVWKKIDRPHRSLDLNKILQGIIDFSKRFKGRLVTETMMVKGINDDVAHLKKVADFLKRINPDKAYILVPTRPPAETAVERPSVEALRNAYDIFLQNGIQTELIAGDEEDNFYFSDDFVNDLLSITAVHPVREDVIINLLNKRNLDNSIIERLENKQLITSYEYEGKKFYKRNFI